MTVVPTRITIATVTDWIPRTTIITEWSIDFSKLRVTIFFPKLAKVRFKTSSSMSFEKHNIFLDSERAFYRHGVSGNASSLFSEYTHSVNSECQHINQKANTPPQSQFYCCMSPDFIGPPAFLNDVLWCLMFPRMVLDLLGRDY